MDNYPSLHTLLHRLGREFFPLYLDNGIVIL